MTPPPPPVSLPAPSPAPDDGSSWLIAHLHAERWAADDRRRAELMTASAG